MFKKLVLVFFDIYIFDDLSSCFSRFQRKWVRHFNILDVRMKVTASMPDGTGDGNCSNL